jgi:hypothetical protein
MSIARRKSESEVNVSGFPIGHGYSLLETMGKPWTVTSISN